MLHYIMNELSKDITWLSTTNKIINWLKYIKPIISPGVTLDISNNC
jgi:hypothetical protein